ncbi:flagellar basal body P-ring formation chaperone FlgA [Rhodovulum adriaticum]|uniref:Flagella basal body P-ring formation protein FlgA n=1 Tax=Rhodovulum adriaticum TaxID=35804 RepID=A0A4R2NZP3_RHOAD|nr:flagellar basal body P-ring formation chaperone FlgA [Rhodovulum adriaticum]MBK1634768.1 flagella basal body P-ring formation protein FlgA [Rhodovulum adriaticum]TCP27657.1 flagella basal body P-ring formation protein FlgA [Rhodovulum adriaticum]
MRALAVTLIMASAAPALADMLVATRAIRAATVLAPGDVALAAGQVPGALDDPAQAIGQEARVTLYPGRPIMAGNLGPPALIERNQIVTLTYVTAGLRIRAEGRALDRAGAGDRLRVMNLASRSTVTGTATAAGHVAVGPATP